MSQLPGPEDPGRRSFFQWVIRGSAAAIAAITIIPGAGFLLAPIIAGANRQRKKVLFQSPADAASPTFVAARIEGQEETAPGIFVRTVDGKPQALSARCTHAGCAVTWRKADNEFFCPCHQGRFDENGLVKSGPPPRPLEHLPTEAVNGDIYVVETES
jgi:Rieske Fe-S protein